MKGQRLNRIGSKAIGWCFLLVLAAVFCGLLRAEPALAQVGISPALRDLHESAKKEGRAVYWGAIDPAHFSPLVAAFKRQFPGVEVDTFEIQSDDIVQRLIAEARAGRLPDADIVEVLPRHIIALQNRQLLKPHSDWGALFGLSSDEIYGDGVGIMVYGLVYIVAANTKLLEKSDYPKTWDDLLDPRWRGKLIIEQRVRGIGGLALVRGEEWLKKLVVGLKAQNPIFTRGGTTAFNQMLSGQAPLCIGPYLHQVVEARDKGSPADWVPLSPVIIDPKLMVLHARARRPNAGKLFAGWLATPSAQKILEEVSGRASFAPNSGTKTAELLKRAGVELIVENEKIADRRVELEKLVQQLLGVRR